MAKLRDTGRALVLRRQWERIEVDRKRLARLVDQAETRASIERKRVEALLGRWGATYAQQIQLLSANERLDVALAELAQLTPELKRISLECSQACQAYHVAKQSRSSSEAQDLRRRIASAIDRDTDLRTTERRPAVLADGASNA